MRSAKWVEVLMGRGSTPRKPSREPRPESSAAKDPKAASPRADVFDEKSFSKDRDAFLEMLSQYPEFESCW